MLRECPFCGSGNVEIVATLNENYGKCNHCFSFSPSGNNKEEAIEKWNKRTSDSELEKTIANLKHEITRFHGAVEQHIKNDTNTSKTLFDSAVKYVKEELVDKF